MIFFTLIHICADEQSLHNSRTNNFDSQIQLYLACAKQLHYTLREQNLDLVVLTNDKNYLQKLNTDDYKIEIIEIAFTLKVPSGIKFYSAHFKLEVFQFLALQQHPYVALVDSDMLCVNSLPESLQNIIDLKMPMYYDITDQTAPAYGHHVIIADKERLIKNKSAGTWAGGEFISGTPAFFHDLSEQVKNIQEQYFSSFSLFHHQGDEMITSVAIEKLIINRKHTILDAGALSIIGRFWSAHTLHVQKPIKAYYNHFLLHLPADKVFISKLKKDQLKGKAFFKKYTVYLSKKIYRKLIRNMLIKFRPTTNSTK